MTYYLGIDLGTTFTAAAVWRDGRVEVCSLGNKAPAIPSVVLLREDEAVLTGEAAERRAATEPHRVAREFKRRVGDPTPIIVGGAPYSADALTAKLLRSVLDQVTGAEGAPPAGIAVCHPANWGEYKKDLLRQAITQADLDDVAMITEPEAAAIHYASQERVEPGAVIAVYDLGGGTFDAAVLRKVEAGWEILGEPQGVERLGGVDIDEAVFQHVVGVVGEPFRQLDPDDVTARAAVARLRQECVDAKEALSADVDASIPVLLPTVQTEVRLTRTELEQMIRPRLADSITALQRALRLADVEPDDVTAVLLVGGSSRIPLVAQLVSSEVRRPVAVDAHPKYGIALGAAMIAAEHGSGGAAVTDEVRAVDERQAPPVPIPVIPPGGAGDMQPIAATSAEDVAGADGEGDVPEGGDVGETVPISAVSDPGGGSSGAGGPGDGGLGGYGDDGDWESWDGDGADDDDEPGRKVPVALIAGGTAAVLLLILAILLWDRNDDPDDDGDLVAGQRDTTTSTIEPETTTTTGQDTTTSSSEPPTTSTSTSTTTTTEPQAHDTFVNITNVALEGDSYLVHFDVQGFTPSESESGLHTHFFLSPTYEPENVGSNGQPPGDWHLTYATGSFLTQYGPGNKGDATHMCATIANSSHGVADRERETSSHTRSGNCYALP